MMKRDDVEEGQIWRERETGIRGLIDEFDRESVYVLIDGAVQQVPVDWLLENCELMS